MALLDWAVRSIMGIKQQYGNNSGFRKKAKEFGHWLKRTFDPSGFNAQQEEITRNFNSAEAQKQRDWEQYMSNTAYQRASA